jgi:spore coat protein U-like protein
MHQTMRRLQSRFLLSVIMTITLTLTLPTVIHASGPVTSSGFCEVAATPVAFGTYDPLRHRDAATVGMLHYRCSGARKRLTIGLTTGVSGSFKARHIGQGKNAIEYNLYLDAAGTQVWGDGTGGSQAYIVNSPVSGNEVSIPVYGRLFGDQNASAGNYQDSVSVVVSY